ncbi:hypothetical protein [Amycolatopsis sp. NPDC050768]|uniref:hypothetical protein n=1 Tax=Amycolatopsis sp. NPDC050768 TaxID=3154839 RepID=UPI0033FFA6DC
MSGVPKARQFDNAEWRRDRAGSSHRRPNTFGVDAVEVPDELDVAGDTQRAFAAKPGRVSIRSV